MNIKTISNPSKPTFDPRSSNQRASMMKLLYPQGVNVMNKMIVNQMQMYRHMNPQIVNMHGAMPPNLMGMRQNMPSQRMGSSQEGITLNQLSSGLNSQSGSQNASNQNNPQQNKKGFDPRIIQVKFIPPQKNTIGWLGEYFEKFGPVQNIFIRSELNYAKVSFKDPETAKRAAEWVDPIMGIPTIKVNYNPDPNMNVGKSQGPNNPNIGTQRAPVGANLTFESDEVRKQKEEIKRKREQKAMAKQKAEELNNQLLQQVKKLNSATEKEKQDVKKEIASIKSNLNEVMDKIVEEKKKEIEARKKPVVSNKYVSDKVKPKPVNNLMFELTLKIKEGTLESKNKAIFDKLNKVTTKIDGMKQMQDGSVWTKLLHSSKEKLLEDISNLNCFDVVSWEELKTEKPPGHFGGFHRGRGRKPYSPYYH
jgi:hypothetical protein